MKSSQIINKLQINELLGKGHCGMVYKCSYNGQTFALKKEKRLKQYIDDKNSFMWNEITFAQHFYNLYPNHFMKLFEYKIINDCVMENSNLPHKKEFNDSKYCSLFLYEYLPKMLDTNSHQIFVQLVYFSYITLKHGWYYYDFKDNNLALKKTNDKQINVLKYKLNVDEYTLCPIDYGYVVHKEQTELMQIMNNNRNYSYQGIINFLYSDFSVSKKLSIQLYHLKNKNLVNNIFASLKKTNIYKKINNYISGSFYDTLKIDKRNILELEICKLLYPNIFKSITPIQLHYDCKLIYERKIVKKIIKYTLMHKFRKLIKFLFANISQ